ncbi:Protein piccolo [Pleurostoma richardsiae]|uniref:Protein piccolo n=1 Tax=Pleurostoma richardsiae TaxID=41990 RepID=A0AA38VIY4_9PEZI|nr:Protein piccolo [Pleurostoma richardsiae]
MNFQNLNFDYVERPRAYAGQPNFYPRTPSSHSQLTVRPFGGDHQDDLEHASSRPASPSPQPTIVPFHAPTPPTPPSQTQTQSESEIYGPDRLFGPPVVIRNEELEQLRFRPQLTLDQIQRIALEKRMAENANAMATAGFRDELALEAGKVTPGVDDTPYIQYALDALTRDRDTGYSNSSEGGGPELGPALRLVPGQGFGLYPAPAAQPFSPQPARTRDSQREERRARPLPAFEPHTPSRNSSLSTLVHNTPKFVPRPIPRDAWRPMEDNLSASTGARLNSALCFRPRILRPASMMILTTLCLLMLVALIFSAVFSHARKGLWAYNGTIYGGQYFLFRVLPAMLATVPLLYAQCVMTTVFRILPFARLASNYKSIRKGALFQDFYPKSFLWPHIVGPWQVWVPAVIIWLANITLPLQSSLFTVILVDGEWRWATVQGVAWTLVALYIALLAAAVIQWWYWESHSKTGLLWDPRSIADIIALTSQSNTLADYRGTELLGSRADLERVLERRQYDRLGYWSWRDGRPGFWYSLGYTWEDDQQATWDEQRRSQEKPPLTGEKPANPWDDVNLEGDAHSPAVRYRYLPWCLRSTQLILFVGTAFVLLLALFIVSFLPSTRITHGFPPSLSALPQPGAFSAADFLYSFIPSLLGLILFLLFQSLELALRVLQPWAELARHAGNPAGAEGGGGGGALPGRSILADYAACYPGQIALRALRNRHFRLAAVSLLSAALALLPALAGGVFLALTTPGGEVRMFPNVPLYAVVLALLVLYLAALASLLPARAALRLPHGVGCLAEVVSFCAVAGGEAFEGVRHKTALRGKLGLGRAPGEQPRWVFGTGTGVGGEGRLGVRRVRRYTERLDVGMEQIQGQSQGQGQVLGQGRKSLRESRRERRMAAEAGQQRISPQYVFRSPAR